MDETSFSSDTQFFKDLSWEDILSKGPLRHDSMQRRRQAEALHIGSFPFTLDDLECIYFRSYADYKQAIKQFPSSLHAYFEVAPPGIFSNLQEKNNYRDPRYHYNYLVDFSDSGKTIQLSFAAPLDEKSFEIMADYSNYFTKIRFSNNSHIIEIPRRGLNKVYLNNDTILDLTLGNTNNANPLL